MWRMREERHSLSKRSRREEYLLQKRQRKRTVEELSYARWEQMKMEERHLSKRRTMNDTFLQKRKTMVEDRPHFSKKKIVIDEHPHNKKMEDHSHFRRKRMRFEDPFLQKRRMIVEEHSHFLKKGIGMSEHYPHKRMEEHVSFKRRNIHGLPPRKRMIQEHSRRKRLRSHVASRCTVFLNRDLFTCILARLPVKSLLRFKSVCKSWHALISDSYFINLHLQLGKKNPSMLLIPLEHLSRPLKIECYKYQLGSNMAHLLFKKDLFDEEISTPTHMHSDGLLIFPTTERIHVCNPATREFITLPKGSPSYLQMQFEDGVGLGFDPSTKKYKVVRYFYHSRRFVAKSYSMGLEVFTLGADSSWRQVEERPRYPFEPQIPPLVNGALHWKISSELHSSKGILQFDLKSENFKVISPPSCFADDSVYINSGLKGIGDNLCFIFVNTSLLVPSIQIWMTTETADYIWTRAYTITLPSYSGSFDPIFIRHGKIVCRILTRLYLYDSQNDTLQEIQSTKEIQIQCYTDPYRKNWTERLWKGSEHPFFTPIHAIPYVESLLSLRTV